MPHPQIKFTSASYGDTVAWVANSMALAEPDKRVTMLLSWLFGVAVGEVRRDLKRIWATQRRAEQNDVTGGGVTHRR